MVSRVRVNRKSVLNDMTCDALCCCVDGYVCTPRLLAGGELAHLYV
jgi:hypothetical protein